MADTLTDVAWRRAMIAGAASGLVYNVGGIASAWLTGLPEAFMRFGVEPSATTALVHVSLRLGLGLGSILLYAAARDGWGPGPSTAVRVGLLVWFIGYVPGSTVLHELGVLTSGQLAFALLWGVAEAVGATVLGARLYREGAAH
jgi:hypothetical protein